MTFGYYNNRPVYPTGQINFKAGEAAAMSSAIAKPINTIVDTIDKEKKKKSTRTAISVGSGVLVLSALVMLLNPKYSSNFIKKLEGVQKNMRTKVDKTKNDIVTNKFYKLCEKAANTTVKTVSYTNNFNSVKDTYFMRLCTEKKEFFKVKDKKTRNFLKKVDEKFVNVMGKVHTGITKFFDSIGKKTVQYRYNQSAKALDKFENIIKEHLSKLPDAERKEIEAKLTQAKLLRDSFSENNVLSRLQKQSELMGNLERDFNKFFRRYRNGFTNKWVNSGDHFVKNLSFWAQDINQPTRNIVEKEGLERVGKLFGSNKETKGLYDEIFDTISKNTSAEESKKIEKLFQKAGQRLQKANHGETLEYFDKKRDLILGSAPTDILTGVLSLILGTTLIATADTKEQRTSRLITKVIPAITGVGVSISMAAMLVSGVNSMLLGVGSAIVLSKIGSIIDHRVFGNKDEIISNKSKEKKANV